MSRIRCMHEWCVRSSSCTCVFCASPPKSTWCDVLRLPRVDRLHAGDWTVRWAQWVAFYFTLAQTERALVTCFYKIYLVSSPVHVACPTNVDGQNLHSVRRQRLKRARVSESHADAVGSRCVALRSTETTNLFPHHISDSRMWNTHAYKTYKDTHNTQHNRYKLKSCVGRNLAITFGASKVSRKHRMQ